MAKKKPTATQNLRRNIKRTMRSLEKRGYIIPENVKQQIDNGKYQTLKSYQKEGYRKLYENITAEVNGQTVSGRRYRNLEREQAAQKAAQTKKAKQSPVPVEIPEQPSIDDLPNEGEITYYTLLSLIAQNPGKGAARLQKILDDEIGSYGLQAVIRGLAQAPEEAIEDAEKVVNYWDYSEEEVADATNELINILRGYKPTRDDLEQDYEGIYDFE